MRVHRNAKTTPKMRQLIVTACRSRAGRMRRIAAALGISVRTVAKWLARVAPGRRPRRTGRRGRIGSRADSRPRVEAAIVALRRTRATAWQISAALRHAAIDGHARVGAGRAESRGAARAAAPVQRYEWPHVGDLLHVDLKRLGRIVGVGHRIHGDRRRRTRQVGWEYLHVAIDDATRLTYAEVLAGRRCARLCRVSPAHARVVSPPRRPDPPAAHRQRDGLSRAGAVAASVARWAVRHRFTRPYRPQTNGKAERFIQTLLREWAYRVPVSQLGAPHRRARARISASITTGVHTRASVGAHRGCVSKRLPKMNNLFDIHS